LINPSKAGGKGRPQVANQQLSAQLLNFLLIRHQLALVVVDAELSVRRRTHNHRRFRITKQGKHPLRQTLQIEPPPQQHT